MKTLKKYWIHLFNMLLAVFVFLLLWYIAKVYPFGPKPFGTSDGLAQFKPMIYDVIAKLKLGNLGTYSFNNGLGNPVIFNILYYVSSPLNLICLLFNSPNVMYLVVTTLKVAFTALNISIYANSKTNKKIAITIACLSYCFCGWFLIYYYYSSFVDIFMMFPLFQFGLERLFTKKKNGIYIFSLSYMIISNFYLTFPVCIYTILYFIIHEIIYLKTTKKDVLKKFLLISKATLIVFFITFFWLYMLVDSYKRMGLAFDTKHVNDYYLTFRGLIGSLFYGQETLMIYRYGEVVPNISCNTLILISIFYYFLNHKISGRERIYSLIVAFIMINFITITQLDFVMNFFHEIRALPYRYSFILCFYEIVLFLKNVENTDLKDKRNKREIIISLLLVTSLFIFCFNSIREMTIWNYIVSLAAITTIIFLYQKNPVINSLFIILVIYTTVLLFTYDFPLMKIKKPEEITNNYITNDLKYREYISTLYCYRNGAKNLTLTENCNMFFNGKVIDLLTSMTYNEAIYDLKKMGESTFENTSIFSHEKENIILNMIYNLNNKYYIEKIFGVNEDILNVKLKYKDYVNSQQNTIKAMTGVENIFNKKVIPLDKNNKHNDIYYINEKYYYFDSYDLKGNKTNSLSRNDSLVVKESKYNKEITYYTYNIKNIEKAYNILKQNQIEYTKYSDSKIEGKIKIDKNQLIFTSIPYDTNWEITIDGKVVKPVKIFDSLMGIKAKPGYHTIKLEYKYHFTIPIIISIASLLLYLSSIIHRKRSLL